jgi:hypothetical protein
MNAESVRHSKWSGIEILFDDGVYSVISGIYGGDADPGHPKERIGERWNGSGTHPGYPNYINNPLWFCAPMFLEIPVLHGLLDELARHPKRQVAEAKMTVADTVLARQHRIQQELAKSLQKKLGA